MSSERQKQSVAVSFGSAAHPSGGLRFGSQPREGTEKHDADKPKADETEVSPSGGAVPPVSGQWI
jgi:hypothetical protein